MTMRLSVVLASTTVLCTAEIAQAVTLASQPLTLTPSSFFGLQANVENTEIGEDFSISATATANQLEWFGAYNSTLTSAASRDFRLRLFANSGTLPGTQILEQAVEISGVSSGFTDAGGRTIFHYTAALTPTLLTPGTYWVSIAEADPATLFNQTGGHWTWFQSGTEAGLNPLSVRQAPAFTTWIVSGDPSRAFILSGNLGAPPAAVLPEPTTATLTSCVALLGMLCGRRPRCATAGTVG